MELIGSSKDVLKCNNDKSKNMLKKVIKRILDSNVIEEKYKNDVKNIYSNYFP